MAKQYEFLNQRRLPYLLVLPQMVIVIIFFFWPAAQAVWQSFFIQDAFGSRLIFVGFENYLKLFADPAYGESFVVSTAFALAVTVFPAVIFL